MPIEIKIPAVGESITEVQISEWLKSEGDSVKQDARCAAERGGSKRLRGNP